MSEEVININLEKFSKTLGSRKLGQKIRSMYKDEFENNDINVILDFDNIRVVTNSFADELVGKVVENIGINLYIKRFKLINASDNIKLVIKRNLSSRI